MRAATLVPSARLAAVRLPARGQACRRGSAAAAVLAGRVGAYWGLVIAPTGLSAGRGLSDPLYAPANRVRRHDGLRRHGRGGRHRLHLADQARARRGSDCARRSARRSRHARSPPGAIWGRPMWGTYWQWRTRGSCLETRAAVPVSWAISRCAPRSTTATGGSRQRGARGRRRRQRADHSLLGRLVELAAPGPAFMRARQAAMHRSMLMPLLIMMLAFTCASAGCLLTRGCRARSSNANATRAGSARSSRSMQAMMEFFTMGGYAAYVWSAYGITLAVVLVNACVARVARTRCAARGARRRAAHSRVDSRR